MTKTRITRKESSKRLQAAFSHKAFIPYVCCGDPDLETSEAVIAALIEAGADIIELGIPFSDPVAEGPVIHEADVRALQGGVNIEKIFAMVERLRKNYDTPMVMMTYANPVYSYGNDRFMSKCREVGVDGLIIPDAPYEEKDTFQASADKYGLTLISMIAPSSQERIQMIASDAEGFIYLVSSLGVTGVRSEIETDIEDIVSHIRQATDIPVAVGFGISTPEQAREMSQVADGIIIGSAIVKQVHEAQDQAAEVIGQYGQSIVSSIR